jgi:hypothetical protein
VSLHDHIPIIVILDTLEVSNGHAYLNLNSDRFSGSRKSVVVTADQFDAIQEAIREIIAADPDDLGIFASHYFIMEARGIKHHTNCIIGEDTNPYESLCQNSLICILSI